LRINWHNQRGKILGGVCVFEGVKLKRSISTKGWRE